MRSRFAIRAIIRILECSCFLTSTYVLSRKDLKSLAGIVFVVEDWRKYRPSFVNASDCISQKPNR